MAAPVHVRVATVARPLHVRDTSVASPVVVKVAIVKAPAALRAICKYDEVLESRRGASHTRPLMVVFAVSHMAW